MPDNTFFDSDAFAEGEEKIRRATRRVDASSRKMRDLATRLAAMRRDGARVEPDRDSERPVAR